VLAALVAETTDRPVWVLAIATIVLAAAGWAALISLVEARKNRNSRVLAALSARWEDPYMYESIRLQRGLQQAGTLDLINHLYDKDVANPDLEKMALWHQIEVWPNLVETIGGFWREGVMAEKLIYTLWAGTIIESWEDDWRVPTERIRQLGKDKIVWENFEMLAGAMVARQARDARRSGRFWIDSPGCIPSGAKGTSDCRSGGESQAEVAEADRRGDSAQTKHNPETPGPSPKGACLAWTLASSVISGVALARFFRARLRSRF
jgi:hypothetical protein